MGEYGLPLLLPGALGTAGPANPGTADRLGRRRAFGSPDWVVHLRGIPGRDCGGERCTTPGARARHRPSPARAACPGSEDADRRRARGRWRVDRRARPRFAAARAGRPSARTRDRAGRPRHRAQRALKSRVPPRRRGAGNRPADLPWQLTALSACRTTCRGLPPLAGHGRPVAGHRQADGRPALYACTRVHGHVCTLFARGPARPDRAAGHRPRRFGGRTDRTGRTVPYGPRPRPDAGGQRRGRTDTGSRGSGRAARACVWVVWVVGGGPDGRLSGIRRTGFRGPA